MKTACTALQQRYHIAVQTLASEDEVASD